MNLSDNTVYTSLEHFEEEKRSCDKYSLLVIDLTPEFSVFSKRVSITGMEYSNTILLFKFLIEYARTCEVPFYLDINTDGGESLFSEDLCSEAEHFARYNLENFVEDISYDIMYYGGDTIASIMESLLTRINATGLNKRDIYPYYWYVHRHTMEETTITLTFKYKEKNV